MPANREDRPWKNRPASLPGWGVPNSNGVPGAQTGREPCGIPPQAPRPACAPISAFPAGRLGSCGWPANARQTLNRSRCRALQGIAALIRSFRDSPSRPPTGKPSMAEAVRHPWQTSGSRCLRRYLLTAAQDNARRPCRPLSWATVRARPRWAVVVMGLVRGRAPLRYAPPRVLADRAEVNGGERPTPALRLAALRCIPAAWCFGFRGATARELRASATRGSARLFVVAGTRGAPVLWRSSPLRLRPRPRAYAGFSLRATPPAFRYAAARLRASVRRSPSNVVLR